MGTAGALCPPLRYPLVAPTPQDCAAPAPGHRRASAWHSDTLAPPSSRLTRPRGRHRHVLAQFPHLYNGDVILLPDCVVLMIKISKPRNAWDMSAQ